MKEALTPAELAARWNVSTRSLARWRKNGKGPPFVKLSEGKIFYKMSDIKKFEESTEPV